jgi:hypothetical protein
MVSRMLGKVGAKQAYLASSLHRESTFRPAATTPRTYSRSLGNAFTCRRRYEAVVYIQLNVQTLSTLTEERVKSCTFKGGGGGEHGNHLVRPLLQHVRNPTFSS